MWLNIFFSYVCYSYLLRLFSKSLSTKKDFITQFKLWALKHLAREGIFFWHMNNVHQAEMTWYNATEKGPLWIYFCVFLIVTLSFCWMFMLTMSWTRKWEQLKRNYTTVVAKRLINISCFFVRNNDSSEGNGNLRWWIPLTILHYILRRLDPQKVPESKRHPLYEQKSCFMISIFAMKKH